jgi:hypothetical protein
VNVKKIMPPFLAALIMLPAMTGAECLIFLRAAVAAVAEPGHA